MSLVEEIDSLINDIGTGLTESNIRNRLTALKEQAEAVEAALQRTEADVKRLEADAKGEKPPVNENAVAEVGKDILRILAQPYWPYLPSVAEIAERIGIEKIDAEYHVDKLVEKRIVERVRSSIKFTIKGRAYVVENNLLAG